MRVDRCLCIQVQRAGVYMILMCDELLKVPVSWARYRSYKWIKDVTREIE